MEVIFGAFFVLLIGYAIVSFVWGIGEAIFRAVRGDRTPAYRRAYTHRWEDSAGVDSSDSGE
jgi:hypothetical protein